MHDEMKALGAVRNTSFRVYVLLKERASAYDALVKWHHIAFSLRRDAARTPYSNLYTRFELTHALQDLWLADLVALSVDGQHIRIVLPLSKDRSSELPHCLWMSGLPKAWVSGGKNYPIQRPPVPKKIREQVFERDGRACQHCDSDENLTADHIVPFSKGGETKLDNLQTLCRSCNSRKGARETWP